MQALMRARIHASKLMQLERKWDKIHDTTKSN